MLAPGYAYSYTVGVAAREYPMNRITPGDLANSYLWQKISTQPPVGYKMPAPATGSVLPPEDQALIETWIQQGAPNN